MGEEVKVVPIFLGERSVGMIKEANVKVYECWKDFYKHKYQLEQGFFWEKDLIDKLHLQNVLFIKLNVTHKNEQSNIDEEFTYLFPIKLLQNIDLSIHHNNSHFGAQIGLKEEIIKSFKI